MNSKIVDFILLSLAGKIIGDLMSKNDFTKKNKSNLPSFKGVLEIKHSINGRIRFYIPMLNNNEEAKEPLIGQLSRVSAIKVVEVNTITNSLLVVYDEKAVDPAVLIGVIAKLLGLEESLTKKPEALVTRELKNMKEAVNMAVYEKTSGLLDIKSIITILLVVSGFVIVRRNPLSLPNGYTLLRWGTRL